MDHPPVGILILKMKEPMFPRRRIDPRSLMRSVHPGRTLGHHYPLRVWPIGIVRPEDQLPAGRDAAGGSEYIIVSPEAVELRPFHRRLGTVPVKDNPARCEQRSAVRRHRRHEEYALMACPAPRAAEREPCLAVFVPQWAGIDEAFCLQQPYRRLPVSSRIRCLDHEYAPVGVSAEDIEFPVVVSYGRCPHTVPVLRHTPPLLSPRHRGAVSPQSVPEHLPGPLIGPVRPRVIPECRPDQLPVHKVCRMQDLQPREGTEGR